MVALFQLWTMLTVSSIKNLNHKKKNLNHHTKRKNFFRKQFSSITGSYLQCLWKFSSDFSSFLSITSLFEKNDTFSTMFQIVLLFFPCLISLASISSAITNKSKYWICFFCFLCIAFWFCRLATKNVLILYNFVNIFIVGFFVVFLRKASKNIWVNFVWYFCGTIFSRTILLKCDRQRKAVHI